jgi:hypothetical protein
MSDSHCCKRASVDNVRVILWAGTSRSEWGHYEAVESPKKRRPFPGVVGSS